MKAAIPASITYLRSRGIVRVIVGAPRLHAVCYVLVVLHGRQVTSAEVGEEPHDEAEARLVISDQHVTDYTHLSLTLRDTTMSD